MTRPTATSFSVKIFTGYAGKQGTSGAYTTEYGALFLDDIWRAGSNGLDGAPFDPNHYTGGDNYKNSSFRIGDWGFAFVADGGYAPGPGSLSGTGKLFAVNDGGTGYSYSAATGTAGQVQMAYLAYFDPPPAGGTTLYESGSGWTFRDGGAPIDGDFPGSQPVQYNVGTQQAVLDSSGAAVTGTWEINAEEGYILYVIQENGVLGGANKTDFGFSWGMTCANDIIQGWGQIPTVPVPGAFLLLASALSGLGFFGWMRRRAA